MYVICVKIKEKHTNRCTESLRMYVICEKIKQKHTNQCPKHNTLETIPQ